MKKLIAMLLALVMMMSLVACGENTNTTGTDAPTNPAPTTPAPTDPAPTTPEVKVPASAEALLNEMFASFPEENKFHVDYETGEFYLDENGQKVAIFQGGSALFDEEGIPYFPGENAAGAIDMTTEGALYNLYVAEEYYASVEAAASLFHGQNGNTFTSGVLKLKEGTDVAALAQNTRDTIANNHWWCGFPDRFVIATVGDYMLIMYGHDGVGDENFKTALIISPLVDALKAQYPNAEILFDEMIA